MLTPSQIEFIKLNRFLDVADLAAILQVTPAEVAKSMGVKPPARRAHRVARLITPVESVDLTEPNSELQLHRHVVSWLNQFQPEVKYKSDLMAGVKLESWQKSLAQKKGLITSQGHPDLIIYAARHGYCGLAMELKLSTVKVRKANGQLTLDQHRYQQAEFMAYLRSQGWWADFVVGSKMADVILESYFSNGNMFAMLPLITTES